jgi:F0F1-type ATP synthase assembly protein I
MAKIEVIDLTEERAKRLREERDARDFARVHEEVQRHRIEIEQRAAEHRRKEAEREAQRKRSRATMELWTGVMLGLVVLFGFGAGIVEFVRTVLAW